MSIDSLPEEADFVFIVEALPDDGLHRLAIAVEGMDAPIPTMMLAVGIDSALGIADRLNRRLGHDRASWTAFAARCLGGGNKDSGSTPWR